MNLHPVHALGSPTAIRRQSVIMANERASSHARTDYFCIKPAPCLEEGFDAIGSPVLNASLQHENTRGYRPRGVRHPPPPQPLSHPPSHPLNLHQPAQPPAQPPAHPPSHPQFISFVLSASFCIITVALCCGSGLAVRALATNASGIHQA